MFSSIKVDQVIMFLASQKIESELAVGVLSIEKVANLGRAWILLLDLRGLLWCEVDLLKRLSRLLYGNRLVELLSKEGLLLLWTEIGLISIVNRLWVSDQHWSGSRHFHWYRNLLLWDVSGRWLHRSDLVWMFLWWLRIFCFFHHLFEILSSFLAVLFLHANPKTTLFLRMLMMLSMEPAFKDFDFCVLGFCFRQPNGVKSPMTTSFNSHSIHESMEKGE